MADGRWVMTETELNNVVCGFNEKDESIESLPNHAKHIAVDNRKGDAEHICAFCGSAELQEGFGGYGDGFGYRSARCKSCGGISDFVYKDEVGKYFK